MNIARTKPRTSQHKPLADTHILIIEDQHSIASMTSAILEDKWGCQISIAANYTQAYQLLVTEQKRYFLAISDLNLPGAKNGEIIDLLTSCQQPTIAITGYFEQDIHARLTEKGVIDYVLKNNLNAYEYLSRLVGRLYFNQSIHVLIIDDSPSLHKLTAAYLEKQFLIVHHAYNGEEGLQQLLSNDQIRLVLVDAEMPVMDGLTFTGKARQIKNQNQLSIIGISSSENRELSARFLKLGANDFIFKPYSYDEITCRVDQNLNMLEYIEEIHQVANFDYLTKMPNRRNFFVNGEHLIRLAHQHKRHLIVVILDIDNFKSINDTYGHSIGDETLKHVSRIMMNKLKPHLIARLGGEEFGFVIQETNFSLSSELMEKLRIEVEQTPFVDETHRIQVTVSMGATYELKATLDEMLHVADAHLYLAKTSGRNKIVWNHGKPVTPPIKRLLTSLA